MISLPTYDLWNEKDEYTDNVIKFEALIKGAGSVILSTVTFKLEAGRK